MHNMLKPATTTFVYRAVKNIWLEHEMKEFQRKDQTLRLMKSQFLTVSKRL